MLSPRAAADGCCYALGVSFLLAGSLKLYPWHAQAAQHMVTKFAVWKDVFPLAPLGFTPDPVVYRVTVGVTEVILAGLITAGNQRIRRLSACGLWLLMAGAVQTLVCCREMADMGPAVVFGIMSAFVVYQVIEVILAGLITASNQHIRRLSACGLGLLMAGAVQTLICCREMADMGPAVVFGIMSAFVFYQYGKNTDKKTH